MDKIIIIIGIILFILIGFSIPFFHSYNYYKSYKTASKGIINHDGMMQNFCYKTLKTPSEILKCLQVNSAYDLLKYQFDNENYTITFYSELPDGYQPVCYSICIVPSENYTLLKITQLDRLFSQYNFSYSLNEFISKKLDAQPYLISI